MDLALVIQSDVERILARDQEIGDEEAALELIDRTIQVWETAEKLGDVCFLTKSALVYSFATTTLPSGKVKWQEVPISSDEYPEGPPAVTWADFCLCYLQMAQSTASSYKRIWEIYVQKLEWSADKLRKAGKSRLGAALKTIADMWPARNAALEEALVGDDHKCVHCSFVESFYEGQSPLACTGCGAPWECVNPMSYARLLVLLDAIKQQNQEVQEEEWEGHFEGSVEYDVDGQALRWLPWWVVGNQRYEIEPFVITVLSLDEAGSGIPISQVGDAVKKMEKFR